MGIARPQILTTHDCDVVVVGGGPAGLIAARDLAAAGSFVRVIEEHERIGSPVHCTGVLGLDAFDELDLPRQSILAIARKARFIAAGGGCVTVDDDRVRAAVVDREAFDSALAESAIDAGAVVQTGERVRAIESSREAIVARTAGGAVRARAAILACGASYRFNRALGFGLPRALAHSAQIEVPFPEIDHVQVHLGRRVAPGGFGWVVPFRRGGRSYARIGVLCDSHAAVRFHGFGTRVREAHGIHDAWPAPRVRPLPLAPVARTSGRRVIAIGDAAGLVKPTTGGGIYYGLLTGRLAAEVLTRALRRDALDAAALADYEQRWRKRLGPEIRAGLAFRAVTSCLSDGAIDRLMDLARVDGIVPILKQTADFNWHRSAALSLLRNASFRRIVATGMW